MPASFLRAFSSPTRYTDFSFHISVVHVVEMGAPLQIPNSVIILVFVEMIYICQMKRVWNKCFSDKPMDAEILLRAIEPQVNALVSISLVIALQHNRIIFDAAHLSHIGDLVMSFIAGNISPNSIHSQFPLALSSLSIRSSCGDGPLS